MSGCAWAKSASCSRRCARARVAEMAIIGAMPRPEFADLRLDWGAVKRAAGLAQLFRRRRQRSAGRAARRSSSARGSASSARRTSRRACSRRLADWRARAAPEDEADIALGAALIDALSPFDAGQGAVVASGPRARDRGGRRHRRDARPRRRDARQRDGCALPDRPACSSRRPSAARTCGSICRRSARRRSRAPPRRNLRGVGGRGGRVLIAERDRLAREADAAGLFVVGFAP